MHRYAAILIFAAMPAFGQAVRFDSFTFTTNPPTCAAGKQCPVLAIPGATISITTDAAGTVPAITYTSSTATVPCGPLGQLTPAGGGPCTSTTDSKGNFGFWVTQGSYWYKAYLPGGAVLGPYPLSAGAAAGSIVCGSTGQVQYNNGGNCGASSGLIYASGSLQLSGTLYAYAGCSGCLTLPQSFAQSTAGAMLTLTQTGSGSALALTGGLTVDNITASNNTTSVLMNATNRFSIAGHSVIDTGGYRGTVSSGYVIDSANNGFLNSLQLTNQPSALTGSAGSTLLSVTTAGVYASVNGAAPTLLGSGGGGSVTWPTAGYAVISAGGTANPTGLAPVNGNCLVGSGGAWTVGSCSGSGTAVTSVTGSGIISNSSSTGNVTLAWSGTSGGIPYFTSSSTTASSAALGSTQVVLGGGSGAAPNSSTAFTFTGGQARIGGTGDSSFYAGAGAFGNAYVHLSPGSGGSAWDVKAQGTNTNMTFDYGGASKVIIDNVGNITAGVVSGSALTTGGFVVISNQGSATTGGATNGTISATTGGIYGSVSGGYPILMTNVYAGAMNQSVNTSSGPIFGGLTLGGTESISPSSGNNGLVVSTTSATGINVTTASGYAGIFSQNTSGSGVLSLSSSVSSPGGYLIVGYTSAAHMLNLADSGGTCTMTGAAGVSCTSDIRLKTGVSRIPGVLSRMSRLHPIEYSMKGNGIEAAGFDAAEAGKLFPRVVMVGDDGYLQMSYTALVPYLWRAVQELSAEVDALKRVQ